MKVWQYLFKYTEEGFDINSELQEIGSGGFIDPDRELIIGIMTTPSFTSEEEQELLKRAKEGDAESKKKIVCANWKQVLYVLRDYACEKYRYKFLDFVMSGVDGLENAVELYDIVDKIEFRTYADIWIRDSINEYIWELEHQDYLSYVRTKAAPINKYVRAERKYKKEHGREPSTMEIAEASGFSEDEIKYLKEMSNRQILLIDKLLNDDGISYLDRFTINNANNMRAAIRLAIMELSYILD